MWGCCLLVAVQFMGILIGKSGTDTPDSALEEREAQEDAAGEAQRDSQPEPEPDPELLGSNFPAPARKRRNCSNFRRDWFASRPPTRERATSGLTSWTRREPGGPGRQRCRIR